MGQRSSQEPEGTIFNHDLFGIIKILPGNYHKGVRADSFTLKLSLNSVNRFLEWQQQLKHLLNDDAREIFFLPTKYNYSPESICGTAGTLEIECEFYKHVLKTEIVTRHHDKVLFEEAELWYLLYNLLQAAFYLQPTNKKIGDVHPSNIVINEKGRSKIVPTCLLPSFLNNYQKIIESKVADCFLAPEEIDERLIEKAVYPKVNPCRAQIFSIGVTLLMAASLCDCYYLYNRNKLQFSSSKKNDLMEEVSKNYSKYFCSILSSMLQQNPSQRRAASDLFRQLNKFQDEILSLKNFDRPNCSQGGEILIEQEPSIADFITPMKRKGGSVLSTQQKQFAQAFKSF